MRVLFTSCAAHGHVQPMLPMAHALRASGHDVAFATGRTFGATIEGFGFPMLAAGLDAAAVRAEFARRVPDFAQVPYAARRELAFTTLFATIAAPAMLPDLLATVDRWRPDLVVHEVAELAGAIAAAVAGRPSATHSFGLVLPPAIARAAGHIVAPLWERHGLEPDEQGGLYRYCYLDIAPPALQAPEIAEVSSVSWLLRPAMVDGPEELFPEWPRDATRPTVYVTLGTIMNSMSVFEAVLAGLKDEPVNVLVTVGAENDPEALGSLPRHVCIRRYVSQALVLPRVDAVVCHAGSGSMLGALSHGLPLVMLPSAADQFYNAERCAAAGAGIVLYPDAVTPGAVAAAMRSVLEESRYRLASARVRQQIAEMPTASERVGVLEQLAGR